MKKIIFLTLILFLTIQSVRADDWLLIDSLKSAYNYGEDVHAMDVLNDSTFILSCQNGDGFLPNQFHKNIRITRDCANTFDTLLMKRGFNYNSTLYPEIQRVQFIDENRIIAADAWGNILRTEDAGITWDSLDLAYKSGTEYKVSVFVINEQGEGIVIFTDFNDSNHLFITQDFGVSWKELLIDSQYISAGDSAIYEFIDGLYSHGMILLWARASDSKYSSKADGNTGYTDIDLKLFRSKNEGSTWELLDVPKQDSRFLIDRLSFEIINEKEIVMIGSRCNYLDIAIDTIDSGPRGEDGYYTEYIPPRIYKSYNAGETWELKLCANFFVDEQSSDDMIDTYHDSVIVLGTDYAFFKSTDYGETWESRYNGDIYTPNDVKLVSKMRIINEDKLLVVAEGRLYIYSWEEESFIQEFAAATISPNPVNKNQAINITVDRLLLNPVVKVFDITGKLIKEQIFNTAVAANQTMNLYPFDSFTTGTYFIVVEDANQIVANEKIIVN